MACIAIIKGTFLKESLHSAGIHNPASKTVSRVFAKDLLIQPVWIPLMMGHSVTPELPCLFLSLSLDQETLLSANRNLSSSLNSTLSLTSHYTPQVPLICALDLTDPQRASAIQWLLFLPPPGVRTGLEAMPLGRVSSGINSDNSSRDPPFTGHGLWAARGHTGRLP